MSKNYKTSPKYLFQNESKISNKKAARKSSFTCPSSGNSNTFLLGVSSMTKTEGQKYSQTAIYAASDDQQQTYIEKRKHWFLTTTAIFFGKIGKDFSKIYY